jgi:hypothetical protein
MHATGSGSTWLSSTWLRQSLGFCAASPSGIRSVCHHDGPMLGRASGRALGAEVIADVERLIAAWANRDQYPRSAGRGFFALDERAAARKHASRSLATRGLLASAGNLRIRIAKRLKGKTNEDERRRARPL